MEPPSHPSAFSRALARVLFDGRFTTAELAAEADVSTRHLRSVKNQRAHLNHAAAFAVARYCCKNGDIRLSETALCPDYDAQKKRAAGEVDGQITDDVAELNRHSGRIMDQFDDRNYGAARKSLDALRRELSDLEAEINQLQ